jgi:hypothetical protein
MRKGKLIAGRRWREALSRLGSETPCFFVLVKNRQRLLKSLGGTAQKRVTTRYPSRRSSPSARRFLFVIKGFSNIGSRRDNDHLHIGQASA